MQCSAVVVAQVALLRTTMSKVESSNLAGRKGGLISLKMKLKHFISNFLSLEVQKCVLRLNGTVYYREPGT